MPSTVMVVEDEPLAAENLVDALQNMGYEVIATVESAVACVAAADERVPDLALMDINLGGALDGIDAARMLRERFDVPVVFLSGYADERTVDRARLAGASGYLLKPFRWIELKSAVEVGLFRHRLERQLRDRERWLTTTLRAIGDAAIAVDPDGNITFMNTAAVELISERESAVRGRPLTGLIRLLNENTRETIPDPLLQVFARGGVARCPRNTALIVRGREVPVDYTIAPIIDEQGTVCGAVAVIKNLTEQRQAQQQIAIADRLASLGVVTAGIAHEINNPLTYVLGNVEFITDELERLERLVETPAASALDGTLSEVREGLQALRDLVGDVHQGARHVASVVGDLRFLARRDSTGKSCDVVQRMEWALRVTHSAIAKHARVRRSFQPVPRAGIDEGRLGQVLLNLLLNAAQAMRDTDLATNQLTVSIDLDDRRRDPSPDSRRDASANGRSDGGSDGRRDADPDGRRDASANGRRDAGPDGRRGAGPFVRIAIADTGCGMPEDVRKRVFDPFFTTKPPEDGTGLGLAVCQGIVEEAGGDIQVTSEPGAGSCFTVCVPVASDDQLTERQRPGLAGLRARVLVIDDDTQVLGVLLRLLGAAHEVVGSESARHALDLLQGGREFDVIICDLIMPDVSGIAFYAEVAKRWPELATRIIFLSGGAGSEQQTEFFASIPNTLLQKPPVAAELLHAIEGVLTETGRGVLVSGIEA